MRQSEPTIFEMTLDLGMEIEDGVPDCCYGPMAKQKDESCTTCCTPEETEGEGTGIHLVYECGDCGTVVEADGFGLVFDVREKAAA